MKYRKFGRTEWMVSEIGYGMWGMAGWTGSDDEESFNSLQLAVDLGCNFFDTAWGYGSGKSESILGQLVRANKDKKLYTATKYLQRISNGPPGLSIHSTIVILLTTLRSMWKRVLGTQGLTRTILCSFTHGKMIGSKMTVGLKR